jgi:hypothetical protein
MWMAANGRIFAQLINSGELSSKDDILEIYDQDWRVGLPIRLAVSARV